MKRIFSILIFFISLFLLAVYPASAAPASITNFRWTARNDGDPPFVRIAMDLSHAVKAEAAIDEEGKNFQLILRDTAKGSALHQYEMDERAIDFATVSEKNGDTYLDVLMTKPQKMENIRVFALRPDAKAGKPHRLVVDIPIIGAKKSYYKSVDKAEKRNAAKAAKEEITSSTPAAPAPPIKDVPVSAEARQALKGKIICLDPGHGGTDVGAIGHLNNKEIYEKDITLPIALNLRDLLTSAGAKVVMTRTTDRDVYGPYASDTAELQARCDIANEAHAHVFVSIHIDSISNPQIDGVTAYYYVGSDKSLLLAHMLHQATLNSLSIPDRGVRANNFYVTAHTTMPSVLMEMGYISNEHRLKMLTSKWAPKSIAKSLFNGLVDYFAQTD